MQQKQQQDVKAGDVVDAVVAEAEKLLKEDVESNEAIGRHGAEAILAGRTGCVARRDCFHSVSARQSTIR